MRFTPFAFALGFLASSFVAKPTFAATSTASFGVTATVEVTCQISTPTTAFGTFLASRANAATAVSVNCTYTTPYNVDLSAKSGTATITGQTSGSTSALLNSDVFSNSAYYMNRSRTVGMSGMRNGFFSSQSIHSLMAGAQPVTPSTLTDSITVTVTY